MSNLVTLCRLHHREKTRQDGSTEARLATMRKRAEILTSSQRVAMIRRMGDQWLSNAELGVKVGLSASGASYLRNGHRMPGRAVLKAMVEVFATPYEVFNDAMIEHSRGNRKPWVDLMVKLVGVAPPLDRDSEALRVSCPFCFAPREERCVSFGGKPIAYGHEHAARWEQVAQRESQPA